MIVLEIILGLAFIALMVFTEIDMREAEQDYYFCRDSFQDLVELAELSMDFGLYNFDAPTD